MLAKDGCILVSGQRFHWAPKLRRKMQEMSLRFKMENHKPNNTVKENLIDIIARKICQLPETDRSLCEHGPTYNGFNTSQSFLAHITCDKDTVAVGLPMAMSPFLSASASYTSFVT